MALVTRHSSLVTALAIFEASKLTHLPLGLCVPRAPRKQAVKGRRGAKIGANHSSGRAGRNVKKGSGVVSIEARAPSACRPPHMRLARRRLRARSFLSVTARGVELGGPHPASASARSDPKASGTIADCHQLTPVGSGARWPMPSPQEPRRASIDLSRSAIGVGPGEGVASVAR